MKKFSKAYSNMNRLCFDIEKWEKGVKYKRTFKDFDYRIMLDENIAVDQERFDKIEQVYLKFCKEIQELALFERKCREWKKYKNDIGKVISEADARVYETNWQSCYSKYRNLCQEICPDARELANICVLLCYEKYPKKTSKFIWRVAGKGVVENIKKEKILLPIEDDSSEEEYLGRCYSFAEPIEDEVI